MAGGKAAEAWRSLNGGQQPLVELTARAAAAEVDAGMWLAWLADPDMRRRFEALVYRRGPDQCAYWLGAVSSTGHGKFRAGPRARARPEAGHARRRRARTSSP